MPTSPNFRFGALVGSLLLALAIEGAVLVKLSDHPQPAGPAVPPVPPAVFTAPGVDEGTGPGGASPGAGGGGESGAGSSGSPGVAAGPGAGPDSGLPGAPGTGAPGTSGAPGGVPAEGVPGSARRPEPTPGTEAEKLAARAVPLLQKGDLKGGMALLEKSIQLDPKAAPPHINLALAYLQSKQPDKALVQMRTATQLAPKDAAIHFQLARLLLGLKRPQEALAPLQTAVALAPQERGPQELLARVQAALGKSEAAFATFEGLVKSDKTDLDAYMGAAALAASLKQPALAEKWIKRAGAANPRDPRPAMILAQNYLSQKQPKAAVAVLDSAIKARPDVFELFTTLADAKAASGDNKGAIAALQSALDRAPSANDPKLDARGKAAAKMANGQLHMALAKLYGTTGQPKLAQAEMERGNALLPDNADGLSMVARTQLQSNDRPGAIKSLTKLLAMDGKRPTDRRLLAQALANSGQYGPASAQYALYMKLVPRDSGALFEWAQVLSRLKDHNLELTVWGQLAAISPKNPLPHIQRGAIYRDAGQKAQALAEFQKILQLQPAEPNALFEVAKLESQSSAPAKALPQWQKLIQVKPDFLPAYTSLLETTAKSGGSGSATRTFLARALATDSEQPAKLKALVAVMKYYAHAKQPDEAEALLTDIVHRNPKATSAKGMLQAVADDKKPPAPEPAPTAAPASANPPAPAAP